MSLGDQARKIPGVAAVEGAIAGALANEEELPIKDYDEQTAEGVVSQLKGFSQRELRMIEAYERKNQNRTTITDKIDKLTGDEPWSGYDEQGVDAIVTVLSEADVDTAKKVKSYEAAHKGRVGVVEAADKRLARE
jgi:SpoVK/Ycf46/Vps4 family AAA+-type ATPase